MEIVNMKKFIRSLILIFGVLFLITFIFVNKSFSHSNTTYKKICVSSGDTLWTISKAEKNGSKTPPILSTPIRSKTSYTRPL